MRNLFFHSSSSKALSETVLIGTYSSTQDQVYDRRQTYRWQKNLETLIKTAAESCWEYDDCPVALMGQSITLWDVDARLIGMTMLIASRCCPIYPQQPPVEMGVNTLIRDYLQ